MAKLLVLAKQKKNRNEMKISKTFTSLRFFQQRRIMYIYFLKFIPFIYCFLMEYKIRFEINRIDLHALQKERPCSAIHIPIDLYVLIYIFEIYCSIVFG